MAVGVSCTRTGDYQTDAEYFDKDNPFFLSGSGIDLGDSGGFLWEQTAGEPETYPGTPEGAGGGGYSQPGKGTVPNEYVS